MKFIFLALLPMTFLLNGCQTTPTQDNALVNGLQNLSNYENGRSQQQQTTNTQCRTYQRPDIYGRPVLYTDCSGQ